MIIRILVYHFNHVIIYIQSTYYLIITINIEISYYEYYYI